MWGAALVGKPWIASHSPQRPNPHIKKSPRMFESTSHTGLFMSTTIHEIDSTKWTKITNGETSGSYLAVGSETVYIFQGDSEPAELAGDAPIMDMIYSTTPHPYFSLGAQHLYARTVKGTSLIHITAGA